MVEVPCTNCRGTGQDPFSRNEGIPYKPCVMCNGQGVVDANTRPEYIGESLLRFAKEQSEWSKGVFGSKEVKNSEGPWKHCAKEILVEILGFEKEAVEACLWLLNAKNRKPMVLDDIEEIADVMFFVNEGLWRMGFTWADLLKAMHAKLAKNKARPWPAFDPATVNQPVEHIREEKCPYCRCKVRSNGLAPNGISAIYPGEGCEFCNPDVSGILAKKEQIIDETTKEKP